MRPHRLHLVASCAFWSVAEAYALRPYGGRAGLRVASRGAARDEVDLDEVLEAEEGCLSIPGLSFEIIRPKEVHLVGHDLDGNEVSIEADELTARLFQHELDHLDGVLMTERMDPDTKKTALREIRALRERLDPPAAATGNGSKGLRFG